MLSWMVENLLNMLMKNLGSIFYILVSQSGLLIIWRILYKIQGNNDYLNCAIDNWP